MAFAKAMVDVTHIMNLEIAKHKARALLKLIPLQFFGYDWDYERQTPACCPVLNIPTLS